MRFLILLISLMFASPFCAKSEEAPVSPDIHVDQIGYLPSVNKIAFVSSPTGQPFKLLYAKTGKAAMKGMLSLEAAYDKASGSHIWAADFSVIGATGEYMLEVPGLGRSYSFRIDDGLYSQAALVAMKSFYFQRYGVGLAKPFAGPWAQKTPQPAEEIVHSSTEPEAAPIGIVGGWHDGGDNGRYAVNGSFAAGMLMLLHEISPQSFGDRSLNIPESGNGVPDILDETRWEIAWLLQMQDESGGVHHKLTPNEWIKTSPAAKEKEKLILFPISTAATAGASAVWAKAARLYSPYDATFAAECLAAAQKAWKFLEIHPNDGGFNNPDGAITKTYNDKDDSDERFWAAVELYRATEDARFLDVLRVMGEKRAPFLSASGYWGNVMPLAAAEMLCAAKDKFEAKMADEIVRDLLSLADSFVEKSQCEGYRQSIQPGEYTWGSNAVLLQNAFILCLANRIQPKEKYRRTLMDQWHYILGRNPLSRCFVTSLGSLSPQKPHHPLSMTDKVEEPIPGLLVGGPNQFLNDTILKNTFLIEAPPAVEYIDSEESFASNEVSISWNAVLTFVAASIAFF
ncbi:MAG: glycoside hydrolase family 9 protein [Candidatus Omnitrophota bacterium]